MSTPGVNPVMQGAVNGTGQATSPGSAAGSNASGGSSGVTSSTQLPNHQPQQSQITSFAVPVVGVQKRGRPQNEIWSHYTKLQGGRETADKRHWVKCTYCATEFKSRVEDAVKHIARACKSAPDDVKLNQLAILAAKVPASEKDYVLEGKRPKADAPASLKQKQISYHVDTASVLPQQKKIYDHKLLMLFVMRNIPFMVASDPYFLDFVRALRPNYAPAGDYTLRHSTLLEEAARVELAVRKKVESQGHVTLTLDGWTDAWKRSIYAFVGSFPDRVSHLFGTEDFSDEKHTSENIASRVRIWLEKYGYKNFICLLTDNPNVMKKLRRIIVELPEAKHMLELPCGMHGFSHFIGSSLGHEFAAPVVADAQRVVTYIKASHRPLALLSAIATEQKVTTGLHSSNKTRFTSVHDCLQSVLDNERPLQAVVARHPEAFAAPRRGAADPKAIIQSRGFWSKLETLCTVMQPFSEVVMAVQSRTATLADIFRYGIYLGQKVKKVYDDTSVDLAYREHLVRAFNKRWADMDKPEYHLALFLHPHYRAAANARSKFSEICRTAGKIWKNYGHGREAVLKLTAEMQQYKAGRPPFDLQASVVDF
ncbi:hypothetical protein KFL_001530040 [Klebsormidium nitens]|uniref:BED-type domain-containing protein n=1 Tax=Klebsormidium nitens TaxID=105231 RepID=A0A1Y1I301_KLENI|nr:hypothetical protein KFL_001530040 [Klebsormidium nitens]|eukprot:GAQ83561.1 hypothetical protein KFL_001530040 [Klebsormidium nitens]